jgi:hypothetical protein
MQQSLGAAVKKVLGRRLRQAFPGLHKVRQAPIPGGSDLYEWKQSDKFRCYFHCQLHRYEDSFTVRIGWTLSGTFPGLGPPPTSPYAEPANGGLVLPLGMLWTGADHWWELRPKGRAQGEAAASTHVEWVVEDVLAKLNDYAVPYLRSVAEKYGIPFSLPR